MQKQLKDCTVVELKALKADIYEEQSRLSQNLQVINQELQKRASEPKFEQPNTGTEPLETGEVTTNEPTK